ncbi:dTDP-4-dehydrorhamnose 3,5-epimerase [Aquisediminimonas sediminicola]|uniref:dTDP-4-dehydrorhamnose 3,5-epimerase n=1 Tax=Alteraquisediminimonas sediminicola TaxID=2676787 RepID=UPI001C8E2A94
MIVESTRIPDVKLITPRVFSDDRGFFMETWNAAAFAEAGLDAYFVQDNHSRSVRGVLRGMHYQLHQPQSKLVRVTAGRAYDVAVDLRRSSPYFGQWVGAELSSVNKKMMWVPQGFAHGFVTLEDDTDFLYKCTAFYDPKDEYCVRWNDPVLGIDWPLGDMTPILSAKDVLGRSLQDAVTFS